MVAHIGINLHIFLRGWGGISKAKWGSIFSTIASKGKKHKFIPDFMQ
jgi:galactitol-specific phosphotransferase system IIC component